MADFVPYDRVWETTTVTGTGAATLLGAVGGYQDFTCVGNGNKALVCISSATQWEVSESTYVSATPSVSRGTILAGSNGTSAVNFTAGTKQVQLVLPGANAVGRGGPVLQSTLAELMAFAAAQG